MKHLKDFDQINEISSSTLDNAARKAEKRGFKQLADKFRSHANQTIYSSSEKNPTFTVVYNLSSDSDSLINHPLEFVARFVSYSPWVEATDFPYPIPTNCQRVGIVKAIVLDPVDSHFSKDQVIRISLSFCGEVLVLGLIGADTRKVLLMNRGDAKKFLDCVNKPRPVTNADPRTISFSYVNVKES